MKRIAFISTMRGHRWGGSEVLWSQAAGHLIGQGMGVTLHVDRWQDPAEPVQALVERGATLIRTRVRHRAKALFGGYYRDPSYRWLDDAPPDLAVISLGSFWQGAEWIDACARRSIPYAVVVQAAAEFLWEYDPELFRYRDLLPKAEAVYFVSHGIRDLARRQLFHPLENARVAYNPFNVPFDVSIGWPEEDGVLRLACVARLEPGPKGQDILFQVLSQDKWRARDVHLTLVGSGPGKDTVHGLKEYYRLERVTFSGFVQDIVDVWRHHHALVMPSRFEGLPLAQVEAMLCARPCIVTDVPGNAELVEDEVTGFVAAAPAPSLVDAALERAWRRRDDLEAMGKEAASRVRRIVPKDPAHTFAQTLLDLTGGSPPGDHRTSPSVR